MLPTYEPDEKLCRTGLEALGPPDQFDEVVCANDSVYEPLFALDPAFADARVADADLWGMCLSEHFARVGFRIAGLYDAGAAGPVTAGTPSPPVAVAACTVPAALSQGPPDAAQPQRTGLAAWKPGRFLP
jgi:hypothetical protein